MQMNEKQKFSERFVLALKFADLSNLTNKKLGQKFGVSAPMITHYRTGAKLPSSDTFIRIANVCKVSLNWLSQGYGEMELESERITRQEGIKEPSQKYNSIDVEFVNEYFDSMIPLISWVKAGSWGEMPQENNYYTGNPEDYYPCPEKHSNNSFALKVVGESMSPEYIPGEIIFVDPCVEARSGSCVVIRQNGDTEATFKQLILDGSKKYLKALNPNWPNPIMEILPDAVVCGVVIGSYRKRN